MCVCVCVCVCVCERDAQSASYAHVCVCVCVCVKEDKNTTASLFIPRGQIRSGKTHFPANSLSVELEEVINYHRRLERETERERERRQHWSSSLSSPSLSSSFLYLRAMLSPPHTCPSVHPSV